MLLDKVSSTFYCLFLLNQSFFICSQTLFGCIIIHGIIINGVIIIKQITLKCALILSNNDLDIILHPILYIHILVYLVQYMEKLQALCYLDRYNMIYTYHLRLHTIPKILYHRYYIPHHCYL